MPQTISVANAAELYQALSNANGGDTIELAAGDYGDLVLDSRSGFDIAFSSNVTIRSADSSDPAVFSGAQITGAANLTFDGVTFDYDFAAGDDIYGVLVNVSDSQNITIQNSTFDGDVAQGVSAIDDGFGYGIGLVVEDSQGIHLIDNEVFSFHRGVAVDGSSDLEIIGNDVHSIRSDGFNIMQVTDAVIEGNYIHDFHGSPDSGDHADMIQFWTTGTDAPSTGIVIRGNRFDIGEGTATQSIFMRNELVDRGVAGSEMFYRDILIEDNVIVNGHLHGITVGETAGLIIRNNSVLHADGEAVDGLDTTVEIPAINVAATSTSVSLLNNVTSRISGWDSQPSWTLQNNVYVQDQDPRAIGYYQDVFVTSSLDHINGHHNFIALPGGMIDNLGAGANGTSYHYTPDQFHVRAVTENDAARVFDANLGGGDSASLPANADFVWDFGDGTTATGRTVQHIYQSGGEYEVTLTVRLQGGSTTVRTIPLDIAGAEVLSLGSDGRFTAHDSGIETVLGVPDADVAAGLQLGASGVAATVDHEHIARILENDEFTISMTLDAASTASQGELFRIHGSLVASVSSDGEFTVRTWQTGGELISLVADGTDLADGSSHTIDIRVADGQMQIWVDGNMAVETVFPGDLQVLNRTDLTFGNPWGQQNFAGNLTSFDITQSASDYDADNTHGQANIVPTATLEDLTLSTDTWNNIGTSVIYADAEDDAAVQYQVWDTQGGSNSNGDSNSFWLYDTGFIDASEGYTLNADQLSGLWLLSDSQAGSQTLWIRANDGGAGVNGMTSRLHPQPRTLHRPQRWKT